MFIYYLSFISLLISSTRPYQNQITINNTIIDLTEMFTNYQKMWTGYISKNEIDDFTTLSVATKLSEIYYKEAVSGEEYSDLGFVIHNHQDSNSMNTYFFDMETPNTGTGFTKFFDKRFVMVMGISPQIGSIKIDWSQNKCLYFLAILTSDPDFKGEVFWHEAFVNLKIKDAPDFKQQLSRFSRSQEGYIIGLQNQVHDASQYLKIVCPFFRKESTQNSKLVLTFEPKQETEDPSPSELDPSGSIKGRLSFWL